MEIKIKRHNGIIVTATGIPDYLSKEEVNEITDSIYNTINLINKHKECNCALTSALTINSMEDTEKKTEEIKKPIAKTIDKPVIRPRLPNNVIDIKDLDIKKAVTEEALVRCPSCGQAHCLAVNSGNKVYVLERDFNKNEFNIIAEFDSLNGDSFIGMCCKKDTDRKAYFEDLQSASILSYEDFAANNDTEVFCPVCCVSNSFMDWKDAYENPLNYFETEQLCNACGGEKSETIVKGSKYYVCDKCGLRTE